MYVFVTHIHVLFFVHSEGHSEAVAVLYKELYDRGHVNHWATTANSGTADNVLTMDLHGFTRAMAFAAIKTAVTEVIMHVRGCFFL